MADDYYARFRDFYVAANAPAVREWEAEVLGSDHGANSFTTAPQADRLAGLLDLGPGQVLLDVDSGAGWPALRIARRTGCRVVLSDVPIEGLLVAAQRARADGVDALAAAGAGDLLPFRDKCFDAVTHADVLC